MEDLVKLSIPFRILRLGVSLEKPKMGLSFQFLLGFYTNSEDSYEGSPSSLSIPFRMLLEFSQMFRLPRDGAFNSF